MNLISKILLHARNTLRSRQHMHKMSRWLQKWLLCGETVFSDTRKPEGRYYVFFFSCMRRESYSCCAAQNLEGGLWSYCQIRVWIVGINSSWMTIFNPVAKHSHREAVVDWKWAWVCQSPTLRIILPKGLASLGSSGVHDLHYGCA